MGLNWSPSTANRLHPLHRATARAGFRTALVAAAVLALGGQTAQARPALSGKALEPLGPQVTISWSVVVHQPGTVLRVYRGLVGGPMKVIVEREIAQGRADGSWVDQVVAPGVLVYQLRYVRDDGDEVTLGTRFGAVGAMQQAPRSVSAFPDDVSADLSRAFLSDAPEITTIIGLRLAPGDLFRPRPPDPIPRCAGI